MLGEPLSHRCPSLTQALSRTPQRLAEEDAAKAKMAREHEAALSSASGSLQHKLDAADHANAELQRQLDVARIDASIAHAAEAEARRVSEARAGEAIAAAEQVVRLKKEAETSSEGEERAKRGEDEARAKLDRLRSKAEATLSSKYDAEAQLRDVQKALERANAEAETHREDAERGASLLG